MATVCRPLDHGTCAQRGIKVRQSFLISIACLISLSQLVWLHQSTLALQPTSKVDARPEQPSPRGGVGNSRSDFYEVYGEIRPDHDSTILLLVQDELHSQWFIFDSNNGRYQISGSFRLEADNKPRPTDRVIDFAIEDLAPWPEDEALAIGLQLLPRDAEPVGDWEINNIGEPFHLFHSDDVERLFPTEATCTRDPAGSIWLTLAPYDVRSVSVIELSLSNPEASDCEL